MKINNLKRIENYILSLCSDFDGDIKLINAEILDFKDIGDEIAFSVVVKGTSGWVDTFTERISKKKLRSFGVIDDEDKYEN